MEEEILSVISSGEAKVNSDILDSISTSNRANKRQRCGGVKGNSSQFKGVMRQKNGQWGAQLYANHTRIWLGTFRSEIDAAMAYDSAAIKFRTGDTHRNFPWTGIKIEEPTFLSHYSSEAVLSMIRDGSYQHKFMEYIKARSRINAKPGVGINSMGTYSNQGLICKKLFEKELTLSDVGKLSRLVVPKKYAVKYFPPVGGNSDVVGDRKTNDVELVFYDKFMRLWKFRYCYWGSSGSFVFTWGWSRFLKEKELKSKDVISFYVCKSRKENEVRRFCMIDVNKSGNRRAVLVEENNVGIGREVDLQLQLGQLDGEKQEQGSMAADKVKQEVKSEGFKLFGFHINRSSNPWFF
ncbi:AP2/ERF and B3 domain-containing transcription factor At1g50680-like [Hibiscus syriacus]|uniref:AP2/ERF and B3 domain-containing transcription factor At1g50680-like n=1 Tax=Hibiscus syriacus TaxID=106335 RepID=UPI001924389E|nr:AP2/ERF and B3 domain-containing transcription factor At1g50680-like [Hibiscus syriacus]